MNRIEHAATRLRALANDMEETTDLNWPVVQRWLGLVRDVAQTLDPPLTAHPPVLEVVHPLPDHDRR